MGMKLYKKDTSAPCRSVYMVIEILKIPDVEYINMNLIKRDHFTDEYLKVILLFNYKHKLSCLQMFQKGALRYPTTLGVGYSGLFGNETVYRTSVAVGFTRMHNSLLVFRFR